MTGKYAYCSTVPRTFVQDCRFLGISRTFLRMGLIKSSMSSVVARGNGFYDHLVGFRKAPATDVLDD